MGKDFRGNDVPEVAVVWSADFNEPIEDFAKSNLFAHLFSEGMKMVEETAAYLDGPGRDEAKALPRKLALAYAGESMRLTTRLMQVASWLLVQRAISEGEMTPQEAAQGKYRISAQEICRGPAMDEAGGLPKGLLRLLAESGKLYDRIDRLDGSMYREPGGGRKSAVSAQLIHLEQAFGAPHI